MADSFLFVVCAFAFWVEAQIFVLASDFQGWCFPSLQGVPIFLGACLIWSNHFLSCNRSKGRAQAVISLMDYEKWGFLQATCVRTRLRHGSEGGMGYLLCFKWKVLTLCYCTLQVRVVTGFSRFHSSTPYLPNAEGKRGGFCPWSRDADGINRFCEEATNYPWRCWLALQGGNRISNWGVCECWFCLRIFVPTPFPVVCFCASASFPKTSPSMVGGSNCGTLKARTGNSFLLEGPVVSAGKKRVELRGTKASSCFTSLRQAFSTGFHEVLELVDLRANRGVQM